MNHIVIVQVFYSFGNFIKENFQLVFFKKEIFFEILDQVPFTHVFKNHVNEFLILENLQKFDNCSIVIHLFQNFDFFLDLLKGIFAFDIHSGYHFHGHVSTSQNLNGQIDFSKTTFSYLVQDFVKLNVGFEIFEKLSRFTL